MTQWKSVELCENVIFFSYVLSNAAQMFLHSKYLVIFSKENKYKSYSLISVTVISDLILSQVFHMAQNLPNRYKPTPC